MTLDLEPIKAREAAATPGPWIAKAYRVYVGARIIADCWRHWGRVTGARSIEADTEFIAGARTDVPALVAEVERLRADNDRLRGKAPATHVKPRGPIGTFRVDL